MTSTAQPIPNPVHAQSASSVAPSAASGTTSNARSSYATAAATKGKPTSTPTIVGNPSAAAASLASSQHANPSPVNGRPSAPPAVPSVGSGPTIVSSSAINGTNDHVRKPSVTISAQGAGYLPNGTPSGPGGRPQLQFGSINASSPSMANSVPHMPHASLGTNLNTPGPARSPSPIPAPPTASGGRPPSTLGQGAVNFGSLQGADASEQSMRPHIPQGPGNLQQPAHLRSQSSQSTHSNMSANMNNNFVPHNNNRNRPYNQQFPGQVPPSPNVFRPGPANMGQRTPSNVPQYPPQRGPGPNSPYLSNRSPAMPVAHMQQQAQMQSGQPMSHPYGQPYHLQAQQQGAQMFVPQGFDPNYNPYYGQQQFMHPSMNMPFPGAPPSPRPPYQNQYQPNPYAAPPHTQSMSRQSSHQGGPERPNSTLGHPLAPATHTPAPSSGSPAPPSTNIITAPRKSKAITIKDADGNPIDFKKTASVASPPPVQQSRGPVVVSSSTGTPSAPTPPPRQTVVSPQHARNDSQPPKSKEDITREFQEKIKAAAHVDDSDEKKSAEAKEMEEADLKLKQEETERKSKEEELRKAKEEETTKASLEKDVANETAVEKATTPETSNADKEAEARRKQEEEDAWIAELEAQEAEEAAREEEYKRKKAEKAAKAIAEAKANEEEDLRRQEREAEALEEAKLSKQEGEGDAEAKALFAQLKPNTQFGPAAASESGASTPVSEAPAPTTAPAVQPVAPKPAPFAGKQKPAALKLETNKPIEPAQPTAGMQSLKSARFLQIKSESIIYPEGIKSPNPALNQGGKKVGSRYDKTFLLQFQEVFKEKPSTDWDKTVKETVGDSSDSARPQSARTPSMSNRQTSRGPGISTGLGGVMGNFAQSSRGQLPIGTTSEQRFQASLGAQPARPAPQSGFGSFVGRPGAGFPVGAPGMVRTGSSQNMAQGMNSPRNVSQRGNTGRNSRRGPSHQQEQQLAKTMPLTAGVDLKPLNVSKDGWKPASIVAPAQAQVLPGTHMAPDMVQRKVKAALNKMTPEKFDKIANDILAIASQSRDETDGRTLRQVIQLTFEKACDEAHWASMYAKFCKRMLEEMGPEIKDENVRDKQGAVVVGGALFRKYLLNRCQEEFERGWEVNLPEKPEGQTEEVMLSDEYYIAAAAKRKGLGLIQFIGELYKLGMLTLRIMHECVIKLLQFEGLPDEAAVESLVKLLRTIGATMDADSKGRSMIDTYFDRIENVKAMPGLPSRLQFMLEDIVDLRAKNWRSKDDQKGPKTIQEIRQDVILQQQAADMERQRSNRGGGGRPQAGRGDVRSFSSNMPPPDYPRNQVGMDDLKKLTRNARATNTGVGGSLGPTSLLGSRSSSGRRGLGPMSRGEESAGSSRTGTPPVKDKDSTTHVNAFSALAGLDASGDPTDDVASPPSTSPEVTKAQPAKSEESKDTNGAVKAS